MLVIPQWNVTLSVRGMIYEAWGVTYSADTNAVVLTPDEDWSTQIPPGEARTIGFCADL